MLCCNTPAGPLYRGKITGYLAAVNGHGDSAREIFRLAEEKFPKVPRLQRLKGWASINLHAPGEAVAAFVRYAQLLDAIGKPAHPNGIAGLAADRWLTGDKDGAVRDYQRAIAADKSFADAAGIEVSGYTEAEKTPLLAVLAETLRRYPELTPKLKIQKSP